MILFPAVDIKNGECVRLAQGKEDQVTVFGSDPVAQARIWESLGARFLHVVDLDGAFSGIPKNFDLIKSICTELTIPVQLGGGIRDIETAQKYIEAGVSRLIIGTMALEDPDMFSALCQALPGKIGVSLDAVDGQLKSKGWVEDAGLTMDDVLPRLETDGIRFIVYTDISRDGMQTGVNVAGLTALCSQTSVPVIAAGGVHTLDDIKNLYPLSHKGLEGAISGRAVYVGTLDLKEANSWIDAQ
ncbi:1-(5-phosphoribosyl)-5-[(5-phosphoribosylamino)methylideneamino]imidazole-4-carboxamide isomerase [Pseudodesulfovibrio piezophilus]|uniref:1-(5-phosphoribosyl)-5-[(5-phosphoribosylamino)methylideneamino] imidazole-4-carboxamide isomerase n=1 Tax=Pseudodesulfovibrio piezophilus (strain DSM 21447 / JCM 15486 / C1TLV30) TaxID=1322246 RepID=M1WYM7_PSEP2|nr:1-(5-phosphoribosyl)-5-[(5-phosphoribosylamino)methylideneamino]imidazole-4-carboxamide isomerase [Pseudodesulfovibrio piezophilus]CCH50443.1 1-(5-phosphoribosyl)-5-[(5-phosphoribosylamino) methylideneamino] imidazole-4-carboxamide isomerase [Pseudodesulfovibrio piezophilus C1TLV30]